jgi:hypothetical protein
MSITQQGIDAEKRARIYLRNKGLFNIQQLDWIVRKDTGEWFIVEVKNRELFEPPPFYGTGLDRSQLARRRLLFDEFGIDTLLLVFTKTKIYSALIFSKLENGKHFDTKNGIRVYDIDSFTVEEA